MVVLREKQINGVTMKKVTGNKTTKVTPLEMAVLLEVESWDLNDGTQECFYGPIYHSNFDMKVMRGVRSSLVKKGIVIKVEEIAGKKAKMYGTTPNTELVIAKEFTATYKDGCFKINNVEVA